MPSFRIGLLPYHPEPLTDLEAIREKLRRHLVALARERMQLLILPEYSAMELAMLAGTEVAVQPPSAIAAVTDWMPDYILVLVELAAEYGIDIVAGAAPVQEDRGVVNAARVITRGGQVYCQEKQIPTQYERDVFSMASGAENSVVDLGYVRLGVSICYDIEFPMLSRALCEQGAELIVCPSCTDSPAGAYRVETGARARALENQCYVAVAPLTGRADWCPVIDESVGRAAVFGPSDLGFPADGVVASGAMNHGDVLVCEIDREKVQQVRQHGSVRNFEHWPEQLR